LAVIVGLVAAGLLLHRSGLLAIDQGWVDQHVRGQGAAGQGLFVAAATAALCLAVPRQAVSFLGGYAFGPMGGSALAWAATVLACILTAGAARLLGREWVSRRLGPKLQRLDALVSRHPFVSAVIMRLVPAGSNVAFSLAGGVSGARLLPFIAGSALGYVPQTVVFACAGAGVAIF
jgi:uncharacterized membrane protein YdjX (TVP38/TMEM64 family)